MPLLDRYEHGTPCWVDLATSDLDTAKEFYSGLFGWSYIDEEMGEMGIGKYSMAMVDGVATAAIYELGEGQLRPVNDPTWQVYVSVNDIAQILGSVSACGGKVIAEMTEVGGAGCVGAIEDPTGVATTIWQPGEFVGSTIRAEPGALTWLEHVSTDRIRSVKFYEDVLGVATVTSPMGEIEGYTTWIVNEIAVAGMFQWPDAMIAEGVPSMWFAYFQVSDLEESMAYVVSNGGRAMADTPAETSVGRIIVMRDPQGADFCFVEPASVVST